MLRFLAQGLAALRSCNVDERTIVEATVEDWTIAATASESQGVDAHGTTKGN